VTHPLQALVTERLKPFLHVVIVSATLHVYVNQTDAARSSSARRSTPNASYSMRSTLRFLETRQRTRWSCSRAWAGSRCCGSGPASATCRRTSRRSSARSRRSMASCSTWAGDVWFQGGAGRGLPGGGADCHGRVPACCNRFAWHVFAEMQPVGERPRRRCHTRKHEPNEPRITRITRIKPRKDTEEESATGPRGRPCLAFLFV